MNEITKFLKAGLSQSMPIIGGESVTWNGLTLNAIYNEQINEESFEVGGYNPDGDKIVLVVPVASFPDTTRPEPKQLITVRGVEWRIDNITRGDVRWELDLVNKNKRA